ncbi:acyltransferase family protein [Tunturiibacter gelidoferens]|uniref:acyltransferase family protein n=1 Tax=Tunturiibacter gelidiferens TaxID=3069689 RepID=UPI00161601E8
MKPAPPRGLGRYRADIDGLRAIAVLLVVLNHLQFRHFEGGYVGVDVFFVISGYLIGASLIAEFRDDRFSLAAFYERRIRRIFPALLAMLIVVSLLFSEVNRKLVQRGL